MPEHRDPSRDIDSLVRAELAQIFRETGRERYDPSDTDRLDFDLGLSSLEVTTLLTRLTSRLDEASARRVMAETDIATFGDLCRAVQTGYSAATPAPDDDLAASRQRAAARRMWGR